MTPNLRLLPLVLSLLAAPALADDEAPPPPEVRAQALFTQLSVDLKAVSSDCAKAADTLGPWLDKHQAELTTLVPKLEARQNELTEAQKTALNDTMEPVMLDIMAVAAGCEDNAQMEAQFIRLDGIMNPK